MELINTTSREICVLNYGYSGSEVKSGSEFLLDHDEILRDIEENDKEYHFAWAGVHPSIKLINEDIAQFLMYSNVYASPDALNKLSFENIAKIHKKRPRFIIEELGNILGNLKELDSNKSAELLDIIKEDIKTHEIDNIKPNRNGEVTLSVNGTEAKGKLEYGRVNDNSVKINLVIRLSLDDIEQPDTKIKAGDRIVEYKHMSYYDVTEELAPVGDDSYIYLIEYEPLLLKFATTGNYNINNKIDSMIAKMGENGYHDRHIISPSEIKRIKEHLNNLSLSRNNNSYFFCLGEDGVEQFFNSKNNTFSYKIEDVDSVVIDVYCIIVHKILRESYERYQDNKERQREFLRQQIAAKKASIQ